MVLFTNRQETNLRSCISMIEDAITHLGHVPDDSRVETQVEWPAWRVSKGSAHVFILLFGRAEENFLRVTAPVLHLEGVRDEPGLYRHLLELNASAVSGAAFAVENSQVVLIAERSTVDLDPSEVLDLVKRVEDYADQYDDALAARFGGRVAGLSAAPIR